MTDPWKIGRDHELNASAEERQRRGAWYTPRPVVEVLARYAIEPGAIPEFIVDPTCGGGAFLLGCLDRLVELSLTPSEALDRVGGTDIDGGAVSAATLAMQAWATNHGLSASAADAVRLEVADALDGLPASWPRPELVIGNPPFATPLRGREHPPKAAAARKTHEDLLGPYADLAAIHLVNGLETCRPDGRICLVLPQSMLASRDTTGLRVTLEREATPTFVWASREAVFDAGVRVWAPVLTLGKSANTVVLAAGIDPVVLGARPAAPPAHLVAEIVGAPPIQLATDRVLGPLVAATAGFRDEYYGLAEACVEADEQTTTETDLRLVTVGSLDPLQTHWGERPTTFAKRRWQRPVIKPDLLPKQVERWVNQQRRPKIVLPTQSKVFEPVIDRAGVLIPATPVLSIHVALGDLERVAAVFLAPPVVAWAYRQWFGTALSVDALKLAARDVSQLPLPPDEQTWEQATELLRSDDESEPRALASRVAELMNDAYGAPEEVFRWWQARLP